MELNEKQQFLLDKLNELPPALEEITGIIEKGEYSSNDISRIGAAFIDDYCVDFDTSDPNSYIRIEPQAPYVYDIVKLLLEHGLDPNAVYGATNIMSDLLFVSTPYVAADTLALLLEHGGSMDLIVDGVRIFDDLDFDISFDAFNQEIRSSYDSTVHCWFVMLGYGARLRDGSLPVDLFDIYDEDYTHKEPFDISLLKNHQNYTFGISNVPSRGENWSLHIFDKRTFFEVARL